MNGDANHPRPGGGAARPSGSEQSHNDQQGASGCSSMILNPNHNINIGHPLQTSDDQTEAGHETSSASRRAGDPSLQYENDSIVFKNYSEEYDLHLGPREEPLDDPAVSIEAQRHLNAYREWPRKVMRLAGELGFITYTIHNAFPNSYRGRKDIYESIILARRELVAIEYIKNEDNVKGMYCTCSVPVSCVFS